MFAFLFIGGWGDVKKQLVSNVGLHQCPVCHEVSRWDIYQIDKRATVYFVPVWKYSSRTVVVCAHCGNGAEVSDLDIATLRSQGQAAVPGAQAPGPVAPAGPTPSPMPRVQPPQGPPAAAPRTPAQAAAPTRPGPLVPQFAHVPVGVDPPLATWMRGLQGILVKYRFVTQDIRWGEKPYDVPCRVAASFVQDGTSYLISLHKKPEQASHYAQALENDPSVQQTMQAGTHLMKVLDRRVFRVHDARGVDAAMLDRWVKTAGAYAPPK